VTAVRYFKVNDYDEETIENIILASSALPLIFPDLTIEESVYIDGGLKDNVPILPLYNDGFDKILVVNLDASHKVQTQKFPGVKFLELSLDEGDRLKTLAGTFDFTAKNAETRMNRGYSDCISVSDAILEFFN
jgi:NTE family protein